MRLPGEKPERISSTSEQLPSERARILDRRRDRNP